MWWDRSSQQFYWAHRAHHPSHRSYTTEHTFHSLTLGDIIAFGFHLRSKYRLPLPIATFVLQKWRLLDTPSRVTNPRTYELDAVVSDMTLVPCNCTRKGCECHTLIPHGGTGEGVCSPCTLVECLGPCVCPEPLQTFELYQCSMCHVLDSQTFPKCYKSENCSGSARLVSYCETCRRNTCPPDSMVDVGREGPHPSKHS